jgi:uncharacterized protein (TIGR00255 family)
MKSMTGFGFGERKTERFHAKVEMRSYNNRSLELFVLVPQDLRPLEPRVRDFLTQRTVRGKVELFLSVSFVESAPEMAVDAERARSAMAALMELRRITGIRQKVGLEHLLRIEGIFQTGKRTDPEALWLMLLPLLEETYARFDATRIEEGRKTAEDVLKNLTLIEAGVAEVERHIPTLEERIKNEFRERWKELLDTGADEQRILAETAILLVKMDINEEVMRLKAHMRSFRDTMEKESACGKKLDFICQEIGREINTIGSKSSSLELDKAVITGKDALEKIREQLRNVE